MDAKSLGRNIQKYRLAKGMTQDIAAEKSGLSTNYFRQIELGNKVPRLETFLRIANTLDVSTDLRCTGNVNRSPEIRSSELSNKMSGLTSQQKEYVLDVLETLVEGMKKL